MWCSGNSIYYANSVVTTATKLVLDGCTLTLQDSNGNVVKTLNADCNVASYSDTSASNWNAGGGTGEVWSSVVRVVG